MKWAVHLFFLSVSVLIVQHVHASTSDGIIDTTNKWAWSENAGWIDFGTTAGAAHVTDTALSGYAYGENIGWISFNCLNTSSCGSNSYAVANNAEGTLSGYAWGENTGWIDFAPTHGGVVISASGVFSGYAYAENIGWIVFATDHPVTTDWRPASSRTVDNPAPPSTARGGGGMVVDSGPYAPSTESLPGYKPPRQQIIYPDGRIVYVDEASTTPKNTSPTSSSNSSSPSDISFPQNHQMWDRGEDIRLLQKFFNARGFIVAKSGVGSPGNETATFGTLTFKALVAFQKSSGLPATGYFGPLTRAFINTHYGAI